MKRENKEMALQIIRGDQILVHVPLSDIPKGSQSMECYETEKEIIVLGNPVDDNHDCDAMGCSTCFHVRYRFKKESGGTK